MTRLPTSEIPPLTAAQVFMLRDALTHRLADIAETANRMFPAPGTSKKADKLWKEVVEYQEEAEGLFALLPQVVTPKGKPAYFPDQRRAQRT